MITADALHTPTALAQLLLDHHADYLFTVKGNQPRLHAALAAYFTDPTATATHTATGKQRRGRTETRTLRTTTRLNTYLRTSFPFPGIAQMAQLTRTVCTCQTTRTETVYLITALSSRKADPPRLLTLFRGHWHIKSGTGCVM